MSTHDEIRKLIEANSDVFKQYAILAARHLDEPERGLLLLAHDEGKFIRLQVTRA